MAEILNIPIGGGQQTQVEKEAVGRGYTLLKNIDSDVAGEMIKRAGMGSVTNVSAQIGRLFHWVAQDGTSYWIGWRDDSGNEQFFQLASNFGSLAKLDNITDGNNNFTGTIPSTADIKIYQYNDALYMNMGRDEQRRKLSYIKRNFLWNIFETTYLPKRGNVYDFSTGALFFDYASARDVFTEDVSSIGPVLQHISVTDSGWFGDNSTAYVALDGSGSNDYYYKYSLVFDGNQESLMSVWGDTTGSTGFSVNPEAAEGMMKIRTHKTGTTNEMIWNPRVTAINLYRSTSEAGTYNKLFTISCLGKDLDPDLKTYDISGYKIIDQGLFDDNGLFQTADATTGLTISATDATYGDYVSEDVAANDELFTDNNLITEVADDEVIYCEHSWTSKAINLASEAYWVIRRKKDPYEPYKNFDDYANYTDLYTIEGTDEATVPNWTVTTGSDMGTGADVGTYKYDDSHSAAELGALSKVYTRLSATGDGTSSGLGDYAVTALTDNMWEIPAYAKGKIYFRWRDYHRRNAQHLLSGDTDTDQSFKIEYSINNGGAWVTAASSLYEVAETSGAYSTAVGVLIHLDNTSGSSVMQVKFKLTIDAGSAINDASAGGYTVFLDVGPIYVFTEYLVVSKRTTGWCGKNSIQDRAGVAKDVYTLVDPNFGFKNEGEFAQHAYSLAQGSEADSFELNPHVDDPAGWITNNKQKIAQIAVVDGSLNTSATQFRLLTHPNYLWRQQTDGLARIVWFDKGKITVGATHPLEATSSLMVNNKYSAFLNGRQFVGNVKIDAAGTQEEHKDWIVYSEFNQPDVLPISNYIQLDDVQGGEITGMVPFMGGIVVFMQRGVYMLNVPHSDPTEWSLAEREKNIGCNAPDSITTWENGIFFANNDHLYLLNSNMEAKSLTLPIKDEYQSAFSTDCKIAIDTKKNRALCRFGGTKTTLYSLDLASLSANKIMWDKIETASESEFIVVNNDLEVYNITKASTTGVRAFDGGGDESVALQFKTGWIKLSKLDDNRIIRRLNVRYYSGDDITVNIYTDGDDASAKHSSTLQNNTSGTEYASLRVGQRAKYIMLEATTSASTNPVKIRKIDIEVD